MATSKLLDGIWFLVFALGSSAWCLAAGAELGATFDEPIYLRAGLEGWRTGSHAPMLRMGTMPLPVDAVTLPLYVYERWTGATIDLQRDDLSQCLTWARPVTLIFWWQLLFFAMLMGRHFAGPWGGRLAVALLACEPNFLAHAALATTDIAAAAFLLPTAYFFARGRGVGCRSCPSVIENEERTGAGSYPTGWLRRIGLPGLWFGLALFTKASALAYGPLCWLFIEIHRLCARNAFAMEESSTWRARLAHVVRQFRPWWRDCWCIGLLGLLIVFLLCGSDWQAQPSFVRWAHSLPDGSSKDVMVWLAENLTIFSNAGHGLVYQIKHNLRGHSTFLLGEMAERSFWFYYPVLLSIKLPVALLVLPAVIAVLRPRALANWACLIALGLLVYSLNCKVQIGIRLMLPWLAIGVVGVSAALVRAWQERPDTWRPRVLQGMAVASVAWMAAASASIWPHGLCYVNELWGGPERGYTLVSDSNYDWGQGLRELSEWQSRRGIDNLDIWYFGSDPRLRRLPMRLVPAHKMSAQEVQDQVAGRYLAVGTTCLYGSYLPRKSDVPPWLRGVAPIGRTQTFLIFDFTKGDRRALLDPGSR